MNLQGLTKREALELVQDNPHLTSKDFKTIIASLKQSRDVLTKPKKVKVGDVFHHAGLRHYFVVLKKEKDYNISAMLTTKGDNINVLEETDSRFLRDSFITSTLIKSEDEHILDNFITTYENNAQLRRGKDLIRSMYSRI